mmetsp:Transcript_30294/g.98521  ORF Transcript_30294/g.98521 Transcript_30294/m.98521 type:complete len:251 (-) Transcript_30294:52-804(-)
MARRRAWRRSGRRGPALRRRSRSGLASHKPKSASASATRAIFPRGRSGRGTHTPQHATLAAAASATERCTSRCKPCLRRRCPPGRASRCAGPATPRAATASCRRCPRGRRGALLARPITVMATLAAAVARKRARGVATIRRHGTTGRTRSTALASSSRRRAGSARRRCSSRRAFAGSSQPENGAHNRVGLGDLISRRAILHRRRPRRVRRPSLSKTPAVGLFFARSCRGSKAVHDRMQRPDENVTVDSRS